MPEYLFETWCRLPGVEHRHFYTTLTYDDDACAIEIISSALDGTRLASGYVASLSRREASTTDGAFGLREAILLWQNNRSQPNTTHITETFNNHTGYWRIGRWEITSIGTVRHRGCCTAATNSRIYRCRYRSNINVTRAYLEREIRANRFGRR